MRTHSKENNKNSAAKKIVPAVGMLALSATMLSTSTYAWFTMNKEVEMTGLNMTAAVGEGMEISLASVTGATKDLAFSGAKFENNHPKDTTDELGWSSAVVVDDYYKSIGAIRPASSVSGKDLYDATDATNGGRTANNFVAVTTAAALAQRTTKTEGEAIVSEGEEGYYVDIPVHLRTNKKSATTTTTGDIFYKMKITAYDPENADQAVDDANKDLYKAVRVAFMEYDGNSALGSKIYGIDKEYYDGIKAVSGATSKTDSNITTDGVYAADAYDNGDYKDAGIDIPLAAAGDNYGHLDFVVRVWLEGESTSCYNDKQGQSWNIDLAFSLGNPADNAQNA